MKKDLKSASPRPLKVGIVGCGNIAQNHYGAYSAIPGVEVVAVSDVDKTRAEEFAAARGIPHAVDSVEALTQLPLDAISVCTPHPTHEQVVITAAKARVNVLCEKPVAIDVASAERMVQAAREYGITLGTVFQRRFWDAAQRIRQAIDTDELGTPMLGHCQILLNRGADYYSSAEWRGTWAADGGGVLMTQGIHYIDLLQWFMGTPVEVSAKAGTFVHGDLIEVEDTAAAVITFESGAIATLSATVAAAPHIGVRIQVTGTNGATVAMSEYPEGADAVNDLWAIEGAQDTHTLLTVDGAQPNVPVDIVNERLRPLHVQQIADFVAALRERRDPAVTVEDALGSLRIVTGIYESARTGKSVRLADIPVDTSAHLGTALASA